MMIIERINSRKAREALTIASVTPESVQLEAEKKKAKIEKKGYLVRCIDYDSNSSYNVWIKEAERQYLRLKEEVDEVIGFGYSLGSILILDLAEKYNLSKVITLNAPIRLKKTSTIYNKEE